MNSGVFYHKCVISVNSGPLGLLRLLQQECRKADNDQIHFYNMMPLLFDIIP